MHTADPEKRERRPRPGKTNSASERLLFVFDCGLGALLFLAPLVLGGRHPVGYLVYVGLIGLLVSLWAVRQWLMAGHQWRLSGAELLLAAGLCLVLLQLVPVGTGALRILSPKVIELLPAWQVTESGASVLRSWKTISLTPSATRVGLSMYLSYGLLFLVLVQRIKERKDIERLMRWIAMAALGMAVLGLLQLLAGNGRFLGVYEHPYRTTFRAAKGVFINQNHFAHFLALGVGPLIWWLQKTWRASPPRGTFSERAPQTAPVTFGLLSCLTVVALAGLLSFSRGGVAVMFLAGLTSVGLLVRQRLIGKRVLLALTGVAVLILVSLSIYGSRPLLNKIDRMSEARSVEDLSQARMQLWAAAAEGAADFWRLGSGVGSHRDLNPVYMANDYDLEFTHAENGYLQILLETGVLGFALLLAGIILCLSWCLYVQRGGVAVETAACGAAITAGLIASFAHALCDFAWYIPACMTVTIILAASACRLAQIEGARVTRYWNMQPTTRIAVAVVVPLLAFVTTYEQFAPARAARHWDAYLRMALAPDQIAFADDADELDQMLATTPRTLHAIRTMIKSLDRALTKNPHDWRAHERRARLTLQLFTDSQQSSENAMTLEQIGAAAVVSKFPSSAALREWLNRAVGPNVALLDQAMYHTQRALHGGPLQGQSYLHLATLGFLTDPSNASRAQLISQALTVRPHDDESLLAAGGAAAETGDEATAMKHLTAAFETGPVAQRKVVWMLCDVMAADTFIANFNPDDTGLQLLFARLYKTGRQQEMKMVGSKLVVRLQERAQRESHSESFRLWKICHTLYRKMELHPQAVQAAQIAVKLEPFDFAARRRLALSLIKSNQLREAEEHLEWCQRQRPSDQQIRAALEQVRGVPVARRSKNPQQTGPR